MTNSNAPNCRIDCTVEQQYDEWDERYLESLQRLYDIDRLPWPTKSALTLRRSN